MFIETNGIVARPPSGGESVGKLVQLPPSHRTPTFSQVGVRSAFPDPSPAEFGTISVDLHNAAGRDRAVSPHPTEVGC